MGKGWLIVFTGIIRARLRHWWNWPLAHVHTKHSAHLGQVGTVHNSRHSRHFYYQESSQTNCSQRQHCLASNSMHLWDQTLTDSRTKISKKSSFKTNKQKSPKCSKKSNNFHFARETKPLVYFSSVHSPGKFWLWIKQLWDKSRKQFSQ